ncbi:MAG: hypothetical protein ACI9YH_000569 [Colwellia sp.]
MIIFDVLLLIAIVFITLSLIYSSVKLGISPMPSSCKAYNTMMNLVDETGTGPILDLGSGWGSFAVRAAKRNPHRQIVGYELSLLPWFISLLFKRVLKLKNLTLLRQNFFTVKFPSSSVLVCYLYPEAMNKIQNQLLLEQPAIEFVISNNFALPSIKPCKVITIDDFYKSPIYLYKINKKGDKSSYP